MLAPRLRLAVISLLFAAAVLLNLMFRLPLPFRFWFDPIILEFVFGMLVARLLDSGLVLSKAAIAGLFVAAIAMLAWEEVAGIDAETTRVLWWGLPATAFLAVAVFTYRHRSNGVYSGFETLGDASYSLYLIHPLFYDAMLKIWRADSTTHPLWTALWLLAMLLAAVLASIAFHRLIERPLTGILQAHLLGRRSVVPVHPPAL